MNTCIYPDCGTRLSSRNSSGMCRQHKHAAGLCRCLQCAGEPPDAAAGARPQIHPQLRPPVRSVSTAEREPATPKHPDRKAVSVAYASGCSSADGHARVTLPLAPWEVSP